MCDDVFDKQLLDRGKYCDTGTLAQKSLFLFQQQSAHDCCEPVRSAPPLLRSSSTHPLAFDLVLGLFMKPRSSFTPPLCRRRTSCSHPSLAAAGKAVRLAVRPAAPPSAKGKSHRFETAAPCLGGHKRRRFLFVAKLRFNGNVMFKARNLPGRIRASVMLRLRL